MTVRRLRNIHDKLAGQGLAPTEPGKGRNVWYCMGYAKMSGLGDVLALHDCDITTYDAGLLARLVSTLWQIHHFLTLLRKAIIHAWPMAHSMAVSAACWSPPS